MATKTNSRPKYEMRAVIHFLYHEGVKPFEIYSRMKAVYGDKCLSQHRIFEWVIKFKSGIESLDDSPRPGAPVKVSDDATIWAIDEMIQNDRNISIKVISAEPSYGSVQNIITKHLNYRKLCTRWVPRLFTKEMEKRINACKELLERQGFIDRIVTGSESWIHHHIPDSKISSAEWHHKGSLHQSNQGLQLLQEKHGLLSKGVCLQHDNDRVHVANLNIETINKLNFKILIHPPYSHYLAPSDYYLFGHLKIFLRDMTFKTDDEVKNAGHGWLAQHTQDFFLKGIYKLPDLWMKCIEKGGVM
ncbi:hypothetical protein LAZ67_9000866 [Cordylochernes scorpioides]|uniref:Mos1 transposase HTH domain-containing protein n=1 Tax=Cordylochernes scorpioides TaxID=51811 RepID=A0ABY6KUQ0_9ARAC|nr:hypothetical protein LAZ67_9000866 [Cordylochernes scorpioides]